MAGSPCEGYGKSKEECFKEKGKMTKGIRLEGDMIEDMKAIKLALERNIELWGKESETGAVAVARITIDSLIGRIESREKIQEAEIIERTVQAADHVRKFLIAVREAGGDINFAINQVEYLIQGKQGVELHDSMIHLITII
jgi:hypothetical protein